MYHKDQFTIYAPQFTDRLELSNNWTKLRINDLRKEDTGVYTAEMIITDGDVHHVQYNLTVYEPIPPPNVISVKENTTERCNFTLHCSVTANISDLSYSWKSRQRDSTYQPYSNGRTTQISLPPDHQDMELLCIVQNPADQKNASITVKSCASTVQSRQQNILYIIPLFIIPMAVTILMLWKRKKKGKKKKRKESKEEGEVNYIMPEFSELSNASQILQHENILLSPNPPPQTFETLYTCLELKT